MLDDYDAPQSFPSCPPKNPVTPEHDELPNVVIAGDSVVLRCGDQDVIIPGRWILKGSPLVHLGSSSALNMLDLRLVVGQIDVLDNNRDDVRVVGAERVVAGTRSSSL